MANLAERYRLLWGKSIAVEREGGVFRVTLPLIEP